MKALAAEVRTGHSKDGVCRVCGARAAPLDKARVLGSVDVQYFRCERCNFTQTERPHWLDRAYSDPIAHTDVGLVRRNIVLAEITRAIITSEFNGDSTFVDYGGGYGLFVRLLRDAGFDFRWFDPYSSNLFARGLEAQTGAQYELLTAFEVFEHLESPTVALQSMLQFSSSILFSTLLMPPSLPRPGEWWYYALESGQHIALYSLASLEALARRFGLRLYTDRKSIHLLTNRRIPAWRFQLCCRYRAAKIVNLTSRRGSLTEADHARAAREMNQQRAREAGTQSAQTEHLR
jgi:hypothetical protein